VQYKKKLILVPKIRKKCIILDILVKCNTAKMIEICYLAILKNQTEQKSIFLHLTILD